MARHQPSSSVPLAVAYAALVVYASLYPLSGWHHPQGLWSLAFLSLPWPRWWDWFDVAANLLGYLPLGALVFVGALRSGRSHMVAGTTALLLASLLSLALELTQNYLPHRVPSALDWVLNTTGAGLGALLAAAADRAGLTLRWQSIRERWFLAGGSGALTLLLLWPFGLLFPAPVPLGLGQLWPRVLDATAALGAWIEGVPWLAGWATTLVQKQVPATRLSPLAEAALTAFGLLAPSLLTFTVARPGWRRLILVLGAAALGLASTTLSTALNFGPQHALAWLTPTTLPAMAVAMLLAALAARAPRRAAAALGLVAATALVVLSAQAPSDPYFADSLQAWEQGRFIRFHGVAQWVGWLWPYAVLVHLLRRVGARDDGLR
jgi:VanZ family protein